MKKKKKEIIHCHKCKTQSYCCKYGAWIDLEEAKKILGLKLKKGDFFHLEKSREFPSGYCVGTSYEDEQCSFLDKDGLCLIHKVDYTFKPVTCKEFPYENNELSDFADVLCTEYISKLKKRKQKKGQ
jgi:hypothetical protein